MRIKFVLCLHLLAFLFGDEETACDALSALCYRVSFLDIKASLTFFSLRQSFLPFLYFNWTDSRYLPTYIWSNKVYFLYILLLLNIFTSLQRIYVKKYYLHGCISLMHLFVGIVLVCFFIYLFSVLGNLLVYIQPCLVLKESIFGAVHFHLVFRFYGSGGDISLNSDFLVIVMVLIKLFLSENKFQSLTVINLFIFARNLEFIILYEHNVLRNIIVVVMTSQTT